MVTSVPRDRSLSRNLSLLCLIYALITISTIEYKDDRLSPIVIAYTPPAQSRRQYIERSLVAASLVFPSSAIAEESGRSNELDYRLGERATRCRYIIVVTIVCFVRMTGSIRLTRRLMYSSWLADQVPLARLL